MNRIQAFLFGVGSSLAASGLWSLALSLAPPLLVLFGAVAANLATRQIVILLSSGWIASAIITVALFRTYRARKIKRTVDVATMMYLTDRFLNKLMPNGPRKLKTYELDLVITFLLNEMCKLLAPQVDMTMKGATFLALEGNDREAPFRIFAQVNHNDPHVAPSVPKNLSRSRGFAARVLDAGSCKILRDSLTASPDVGWIPIDKPLTEARFRGRAGAPVQMSVNGRLMDIGVVCFDVAKPWKLSVENEQILTVVGDKIAQLWTMYYAVGGGA